MELYGNSSDYGSNSSEDKKTRSLENNTELGKKLEYKKHRDQAKCDKTVTLVTSQTWHPAEWTEY